MSATADIPLPESERQAHELGPLLRSEPERLDEVWQQAVETAPNGHVRAAHVATVVQRALKPVPEPYTRELRPSSTARTTGSRRGIEHLLSRRR
jgi:hypothetical protein